VIQSATSITTVIAANGLLQYAWDNPTVANKTLTLESCATVAAAIVVVKDEIGTAGVGGTTNTITITPHSGDTIDVILTSLTLSANYQSVTLQCDGVGNWMVE